MCSTGGEQHVWCSCWSTSYKRGAAYESWILRWPLQADVSHTCAARSAERACSLAECTTLFNMLQACLYTWPLIKQCTSTECYIRKTNKKGHFWAPVGLGVQISYTSRQGHINGCTTNQTVQTNSPEHLVKKKKSYRNPTTSFASNGTQMYSCYNSFCSSTWQQLQNCRGA